MHPYDSIPWRRKSIMKILSFDNTLEYVPQGSDSTENFMTRMACPWSSFVWHVEIHIYIYIHINITPSNLMKWGQAITRIDYMKTLSWQMMGLTTYICTMYILVLYLFNIFGLCIYKIRARGNCIDTHSLLSLLT